jgi:hypothetical protein
MTSLKIYNSSIVYVAAPANVATGGPELLHQLVYELRKIGVEALMYYYNVPKSGKMVHEAYISYENPYSLKIEDRESNVLIVPETRTDILFDYREIQKVIWWLSIDFYYLSKNAKISLAKRIKNFLRGIKTAKRNFSFEDDSETNILHFVQSEYARRHLVLESISEKKIYYLSDYINPHFIAMQSANTDIVKKDVVAYNPKKGMEFTKLIIAKAPDVLFVPIENMTKEQVADLLLTAKVYIDFGNHPGKDRIPREACIAGACVITNRSGAAKYSEDLPIPEKYKFDDSEECIESIVYQIRYCLNHYEDVIKDFAGYRMFVKSEHARFVSDLNQIFG